MRVDISIAFADQGMSAIEVVVVKVKCSKFGCKLTSLDIYCVVSFLP